MDDEERMKKTAIMAAIFECTSGLDCKCVLGTVCLRCAIELRIKSEMSNLWSSKEPANVPNIQPGDGKDDLPF